MPIGPLAVPITDASQKTENGIVLPLILKCQRAEVTPEETYQWVVDNSVELERLLHLHGAVLFRGFPVVDGAAFGSFVSSFQGWEDLPYEDSLSYAVRLAVCDRVCTTNEGKTGGMVFHHEQAQAPRFPSKLFFYCERPATSGGGTGICPSDVVLQRLEAKYPDFVKKCEEHGVKYTATLPAEGDASKGVGRSWKSFFCRDTKEETEKRMAELGYTWEWAGEKGDTLHLTTPKLPAVRTAPNTDPERRVFFNQMIAQYLGNAKEFAAQAGVPLDLDRYMRFGDGTPIDPAPLDFAKQACEDSSVELQWEAGDVGLLDNFLVMHARRTFEGPRKVLASLCK